MLAVVTLPQPAPISDAGSSPQSQMRTARLYVGYPVISDARSSGNVVHCAPYAHAAGADRLQRVDVGAAVLPVPRQSISPGGMGAVPDTSADVPAHVAPRISSSLCWARNVAVDSSRPS